MTNTVLVTGAAGFIGSHTCQALLDLGFDVRGLDSFDPFYDRSVKQDNVKGLISHSRFGLFEGDIRDRRAVQRALSGADVVVHLAGQVGVRPSIENPALYCSVNVEGTALLLEGCHAAGVNRFIYGSSSSVYGDGSTTASSEEAPAVSPVSPYAATKRAAEFICDTYAEHRGMRIMALRFFTVYGPRQRPDLAIHRFTRSLASGKALQQFGDGSSERDYTHVDDIVRGVLSAVAWTDSSDSCFEIVNLGDSKPVRLDRMIQLIASALRVDPKIEQLPAQPGDVTRTYADISKARRLLGYDPQVNIEDGIVDFVDWYKVTHGHKSP